jgi:hypothetical protein
MTDVTKISIYSQFFSNQFSTFIFLVPNIEYFSSSFESLNCYLMFKLLLIWLLFGTAVPNPEQWRTSVS